MAEQRKTESVANEQPTMPKETPAPLYYVQLPSGQVVTGPSSYPPDDVVPANSAYPYPPTCR
jgi:hypothetical protein